MRARKCENIMMNIINISNISILLSRGELEMNHANFNKLIAEAKDPEYYEKIERKEPSNLTKVDRNDIEKFLLKAFNALLKAIVEMYVFDFIYT